MCAWKNKAAIGAALVALLVLAVSCEGPTPPHNTGPDLPSGATCPYENDGTCDVDLGLCPAGTDVEDCEPTGTNGPDPVTSDLPCMDRDSPAAVGDCIAECVTITPTRIFTQYANETYLYRDIDYEIEIVNSCDVDLVFVNQLVTYPPEVKAIQEGQIRDQFEGRQEEYQLKEFQAKFYLHDGTLWYSEPYDNPDTTDPRRREFTRVSSNTTRHYVHSYARFPLHSMPPNSFRLRWCTSVVNNYDSKVFYADRYNEAMTARFGPGYHPNKWHAGAWCHDEARSDPDTWNFFHDSFIYGGNYREAAYP